jgi:chromosome segregation ATPase
MNKGDRKETENMESLITSIKEQTFKLKTRALQRNATEYHQEGVKKQISNEICRTDLNYSKNLIENLMSDNKSLHEDVEDFRAALEAIANDFKDVKRELEKEKLRGMKIEFLEDQLKQEKAKCDQLVQSNTKIKEKYLAMLEVLRQAAFEITEQEKEDQMNIDHLIRENRHLREMLSITKINESTIKEIEDSLNAAEEEIQDHLSDEENLIAAYLSSKNPAPSKAKKFYLIGK